ncbi:hypothetical protein [Georgenia alba]|uniref:Uncharacterized protein n=1 Tax=Georgenia alba TaxID=2233858 RepID=A0ABW2Q905_9MICO
MSVTGGTDEAVLRAAVRGAWTQLPVLLAGSLAVTGAAALALLAAAVWAPAGPVVAVLGVAPTVHALVRCALDVVDGAEPGVRDYGTALRELAARAVATAAVPAALAGLTLAALAAHARGGPVFLVPAGLGVTATVLGTAALLVLLPLRARRREPGGAAAWLLALHVLGRAPVPFLAAAALAGLGMWASVTVSNGLFLLVPAPVALVLAAAYRVSPAERMLA